MKNYYEIRGDVTEIHLKRFGLIAKIDTEDLEMIQELGDINWTVIVNLNRGAKTAYAIGCFNKVGYTLHRVIKKAPEGMVIDHINHDTMDNRKCNLQFLTRYENHCKTSDRVIEWHDKLNKKIVLEKEKHVRKKKEEKMSKKTRVIPVLKGRKKNETTGRMERYYEYRIV